MGGWVGMFVGRLEGGVCRERWGRIGGGRGREIGVGLWGGGQVWSGLDSIFDSNPKSNFLNDLLTLYIDSTLQSVSMMTA